MKLDQDKPTHRIFVALVAAGLITFTVWGAWASVASIIGGTGWLLEKLGNGFLATMRAMWSVHEIVAWISLACGLLVGAVLGLNLRVDRLWSRISGSRPVGGNPDTA